MGLEIKQLPLGDLHTNCYLIWCDKTREALVIDPADEGGFITDQILELQLQPQALVLTHGHFDHVLGLLELKLNFDIPIKIHQADIFLLNRAQDSAHHWLGRETDPVPAADDFINEGDILAFGHQQLKVIETPGHTPGSISLVGDEVVFTGDTLFVEGVGSTEHRYSSPLMLKNSIDKLLTLPPDLLVCSGHGEVARLSDCAQFFESK